MKGINGYIKTRACGSDVHTFELSKTQNDIVWTIGKQGVLEPLSTLYKSVPNAIAAINCGFFNFDASSENLFTFSTSGKTAIYAKDNQLILVDNTSLTLDKIAQYKTMAKIPPFGIGYPLIENGKIVINDYLKNQKLLKKIVSGDPENRNPRTMIGQLKDGSLFLVVVQGRGLLNRGMTAQEQAQFMLDMGCVTAFNGDGGGSSEMIVDGKIMNKPTDGHERPIGSALVVVKKNVELDFIQKILPGAIESFKKDKVLPSLTLAQGCLESNWGKSSLTIECNNLFGIKWTEGCGHDKASYPTHEYVNGKQVTVNAYFRKYNSYAESISDHSQLLTNTRYKPVIASNDYTTACKQIQVCGYATDPNYSKTLISLIEKYNLNQYDRSGI